MYRQSRRQDAASGSAHVSNRTRRYFVQISANRFEVVDERLIIRVALFRVRAHAEQRTVAPSLSHCQPE